MAISRSFLALCALILLQVSPAIAQEYPLNSGELELESTDETPEPGETVLIEGEGFAPGGEVTITFESAPVLLTVTVADESGRIATKVTIPKDAQPGPHRIVATGPAAEGGVLVLATSVEVPADSAATETVVDSQRSAGAVVALVVTAALVLVAAAAAVMVARRA